MSEPTLKVTEDFTEKFNEIIRKFKSDAVLVGIPEEKADRRPTKRPKSGEVGSDTVDAPINNATILAINNFGSEEAGIPPWPVMAIGIRNAQDEIAEQFKKAASGALSQGLSAIDVAYNRAGIIASTSIKKAINSQEGAPELSEKTLAARKARGFKGESRLIVTGQMRNAITYVVNGKTRGQS